MKAEDIPDFLKHLPIYKGYPVPYFVAYRVAPGPDGELIPKPDFRFTDPAKHKACLQHKKCFICGKPLGSGATYLIAGPQGLANRISTDTQMHLNCAEFSLNFCPHLHLEKVERREDETVPLEEFQIKQKPQELFLVKTGQYLFVPANNTLLTNYQPLAYKRYIYEEGKLVSDEWGWQRPAHLREWKHTNARKHDTIKWQQ